MAALILENNYLIPASVKASYAEANLHLLVVTDLDSVENEFADPV